MVVELNGMEFHLTIDRPRYGYVIHIADEGFRNARLTACVETSEHIFEVLADYAGVQVGDTLKNRVLGSFEIEDQNGLKQKNAGFSDIYLH